MKYLKLLGIMSLAAVVVLIPGHARASTVSISPLRQELTLKPGQAFTSKLQVANYGNAPTMINLTAQPFIVSGENYDYNFATSENTAGWVSFTTPQVTLAPGANAFVGYTVGVPTTAEPGERYLAVFASTSAQPVDNVTAIDRVGMLLYIDVGGNLTRHGQVLNLALPWVTLSRGNPWSLKLNNTGSAHFDTRLTIWVADVFGRTLNANASDHLSLPGTVRLLRGNVQTDFWPGIYRVRFKVGLGDDPAYNTTRWILYAPIWSIMFLILIVIAAIKLTPTIKQRMRAMIALQSAPVPSPTAKAKPKPKTTTKPRSKAPAKAKPKPKKS